METKKLDVLIVEDNENYLGLIEQNKSKFEEEYNLNFQVVKTFEDYKKIVSEKEFDIVITDMLIPYNKDEKRNRAEVQKYLLNLLEDAKKYCSDFTLRALNRGESDEHYQGVLASVRGFRPIIDEKCVDEVPWDLLVFRLSEFRF